MTTFAYNFHYKPTGMTSNSKPAGLSLYGIDGDEGSDGLIGSTTYFFDALIITDTQKETILTRIDNGQLLDGSGPSLRSYVYGDLIICKQGSGGQNNVYRIVNPTSSNHRFDLQFLGIIYQPLPANAIIDYYLDEASLKLNLKPTQSTSLIPVNRSFDSSTELYYTNGDALDITVDSDPEAIDHISQPYENTFKTLYGFETSPSIIFNNEDIPRAFDFYLKITIPMEKGLMGSNGYGLKQGYSNVYDGDDDSHFMEEPMIKNKTVMKFEKVLEIPMTKYNGTSLIDASRQPTYISDMSADKLHPADNNINVTFFDPKRSKGWKLKDNPDVTSRYYVYDWFRLHFDGYDYNVDGRNIMNTAFRQAANKQDFYDRRIESPLMTKSYDVWHPMIQCTKRKKLEYPYEPNVQEYVDEKCIVNFRSGESAYFSGMVPCCFPDSCFHPKHYTWGQHADYIGSGPYHTYDAYVTMNRCLNINNRDVDIYNNTAADQSTYVNARNVFMQDYMSHVLIDFVFNTKNTFELVYVEKATGLTKCKKLNMSDLQFNYIS